MKFKINVKLHLTLLVKGLQNVYMYSWINMRSEELTLFVEEFVSCFEDYF